MNFLEALKNRKQSGRIPVIPDIKAFSPKEGSLLCGRDPAAYARQLESAGAPVLSVVEIPQDKAHKCMAQVEAADYTVKVILKDATQLDVQSKECRKQIEGFLAQDCISITKKTKKNEAEVNIRPFIFSFTADDEGLHLRLKAGSTDHVKCAAAMEKFLEFAGIEAEFVDIRRDELLMEKNGEFLPLYKAGKEIL